MNSAFHTIREYKKIKKIAVITWSKKSTNPMNFRNDEWSKNLLKTIPTNSYDFIASNSKYHPTIRDLRPKSIEFSKNPKYPLSIWHHGFLNACDNPDKIINELY